MKPTNNGIARDRIFFPLQAGSLLWNYYKFELSGLQNLGTVKFPVKTGLLNVLQVPFKTGFTV